MAMPLSAMERVLRQAVEDNRPLPWGQIQRIMNRQSSSRALKASFQRIVEEPDIPMEIFIFAVHKISFIEDLTSHLTICIHNIWRRVLVDRETIACLTHYAGPCHANINYIKELLAIQSRNDLVNNPLFLNAFKKTKYLIQTILLQQQQQTDPQNVSPNGKPFVHALIEFKLPPFLIWLAAKDDPETLKSRDVLSGKLPLHVALEVKMSRIISVQDSYRIRFCIPRKKELPDDNTQHLLNLWNRPTPIQLLCHLYPQAGSQADFGMLSTPTAAADNNKVSTVGHIPLETFLYTMEHLASNEVVSNNDWYQHMPKILLEDIQAVIRIAPQALDTPSRNTRLLPFIVPMLYWFDFQYGKSRLWLDQIPPRDNFPLTLSYTLLKENPMVLTRFLPSIETPIEPWTAYGKVLKNRIVQAEDQIQSLKIKQAELKRRIAELENDSKPSPLSKQVMLSTTIDNTNTKNKPKRTKRSRESDDDSA